MCVCVCALNCRKRTSQTEKKHSYRTVRCYYCRCCCCRGVFFSPPSDLMIPFKSMAVWKKKRNIPFHHHHQIISARLKKYFWKAAFLNLNKQTEHLKFFPQTSGFGNSIFFHFWIPRKMMMTMMMILMVLCGKQATVMMTGSGSEKKNWSTFKWQMIQW